MLACPQDQFLLNRHALAQRINYVKFPRQHTQKRKKRKYPFRLYLGRFRIGSIYSRLYTIAISVRQHGKLQWSLCIRICSRSRRIAYRVFAFTRPLATRKRRDHFEDLAGVGTFTRLSSGRWREAGFWTMCCVNVRSGNARPDGRAQRFFPGPFSHSSRRTFRRRFVPPMGV